MQIAMTRPDGLHILTRATLQQLAEDETLRIFAEGLLSQALAELPLSDQATWTLAETLHHSDSARINALLTTLLVLDAEVNAVIDGETRVFPLPGFLGYRHHLPLDEYPLNIMRLPPLNPDGHYIFKVLEKEHYLAVRLDLHPELKVSGHVRIAVSSPTRSPERLLVAEHRLDRQELNAELIEAAITAGNETLPVPLTSMEQGRLIEVLKGLIVG